MNSNVIYLKLKNLAKLEKMIKANAPYEKILKQNQIVVQGKIPGCTPAGSAEQLGGGLLCV